MRVTTIIKDYITREVNAKYEQKLETIPDDYQEDYNKMVKEIELLAKQCNEKAKEIAKKYDMLEDKDYTIINYHTYRLGNEDRREARREIERKLVLEKNRKIAQIILDLELGETTKKQLTEVLSNIEF